MSMLRAHGRLARWARALTGAVLAVTCLACDEELPVSPSETGDIAGTVTVNGVPHAGVTVTVSDGSTTTTDASGTYRFDDTPLGAHTVSISGFPPDVEFSSSTKAVVLTAAGQEVRVDFVGVQTSPLIQTDLDTLRFAHERGVSPCPQPIGPFEIRNTTNQAVTVTVASSHVAIVTPTGAVDIPAGGTITVPVTFACGVTSSFASTITVTARLSNGTERTTTIGVQATITPASDRHEPIPATLSRAAISPDHSSRC